MDNIDVKISGFYKDINEVKKILIKKYKLNNTYKNNTYYYIGKLKNKKQFYRLKKLCQQHNLKIEINNGFGERSNNYRYTYFSNNRPIYKKYYRCVYCGKLISKNKITVDHIYPVKLAKENLHVQNKLLKLGAKDVNSACNLVAACRRCNSKKGAQLNSKWIIKAKLGKLRFFWPIIKIIKVIVVISIIIFIKSQFCI